MKRKVLLLIVLAVLLVSMALVAYNPSVAWVRGCPGTVRVQKGGDGYVVMCYYKDFGLPEPVIKFKR